MPPMHSQLSRLSARLAQRVPVRIHIDDVPSDVRLVAGLTAIVEINPNPRKTIRE
jgi:multidrug resistance efflux pump